MYKRKVTILKWSGKLTNMLKKVTGIYIFEIEEVTGLEIKGGEDELGNGILINGLCV